MFIEKKKLNKKAQKELNSRDRLTWGNLNPITRIKPNAKAYNRQQFKRVEREEM